MLIKSYLNTPFRAEALATTVYVRNRLPTNSLPNRISIHEAWFNEMPSIKHLRQFGCIAYAQMPGEKLVGISTVQSDAAFSDINQIQHEFTVLTM